MFYGVGAGSCSGKFLLWLPLTLQRSICFKRTRADVQNEEMFVKKGIKFAFYPNFCFLCIRNEFS